MPEQTKLREITEPETGTQPIAPHAGAQGAALGWQAVAASVGFALGAGKIYGGAAPFGLAMVMGCAPGYMLAAAAGTMIGALLFQPIQLAVELVGALLAIVAARRLVREHFWPVAASGGAVLLLEQVAAGFGLPITGAQNAAVLCTAVLAVLFGAAIRRWPSEKPSGICLWLAMLTAATQSFTLYGFAPGLALAALAGLCTAYAGSLAQCAVLAVALAAALSAASPALCYAALAVALGTLAAGCLCPGERWRCIGVFCAGCFFGALSAPELSGAWVLLAGAGCGVLLFAVVPERLLRSLFPPPAPPAAAQGLPGAARRLAAVADTLSDIAETVNAVCERQMPPKGETYDFVVERTARAVCQGCARRSACWIKGYSNAMDGLYHLKPILEQRGSLRVEDLPGQLTVCIHPADLCDSATRSYRIWRSRRQNRARAVALRSALTEQYGAMASALAQLAARLSSAGLPDPRREARVEQLFASIGLDALECSVTTDTAGRVCAAVTVARTAFSDEELHALTAEMSRICRRSFAVPDVTNSRAVTMLNFGERPLLYPTFGVASRPAQEISGDATDQFCDSAGRAQMFLCDGMGTGRPAAVDGRLTARLMGQLLRAGFAAESAARLVNVALGLRSTEQESGATLDLLTVDLFTGRAGLFKAGAAPSFLVRGGVPRLMEGASLPMGVLDSVVGRSTSFALDEGDLVVLVSDGTLCDGPDWLVQQLQLCARLNHTPQQMADVVADTALRRAPARRDDITVLVMQLQAHKA
jgi:stage II sporulation protein E